MASFNLDIDGHAFADMSDKDLVRAMGKIMDAEKKVKKEMDLRKNDNIDVVALSSIALTYENYQAWSTIGYVHPMYNPYRGWSFEKFKRFMFGSQLGPSIKFLDKPKVFLTTCTEFEKFFESERGRPTRGSDNGRGDE